MSHELVQGNGILQSGDCNAELLPGQERITTVMASDPADLGMGESSKNRDLVTKRLQHLKGLVEGKVPARSLRKPVPLPELALLLGQAHSVGEIYGTEPSWRHLGTGTRKRLHPRQCHGNPGGLEHGPAIHMVGALTHQLFLLLVTIAGVPAPIAIKKVHWWRCEP